MGKAKPVSIGNLNFKNQAEALKFYSRLLGQYMAPSALTDEDHEMILELLQHHPDAKLKIGVGVQQIVVDHDEKGTQCFHVLRKDGTKENFSYKKCITGQGSLYGKFLVACRKVVEDQVNQYKVENFALQAKEDKIVCPISGVLLDWDHTHVDHMYPMTFARIVRDFININGIDVTLVEYIRENTYGPELKDQDIKDKFYAWHKKKAVLRLISAKENLKLSYLGRNLR